MSLSLRVAPRVLSSTVIGVDSQFEEAKRLVKAGDSDGLRRLSTRFTPTKGQFVILSGLARDREQAGLWR